MKHKNNGFVYIAGAGPWDAGLLTLKCADALTRADTVVYDALVNPTVLTIAKNAELIFAGKRAGNHAMEQDEINRLLLRLASESKTVVRLKGGDPYIFGRGAEEALYLKEHGIKYEIISGVSSAYAVPASAGISVTDRNTASSVHIITAHPGGAGKKPGYKTLARLEGTLVFMMGKSRLGEISSELIKYGKPENTPCAVVSEGTSPRMRCAAGTLADIEKKAAELPSPAVAVVGAAAENACGKNGGELFGKRIICAGLENTLAGLENEIPGAQLLRIPIIKTIKKERVKAPDITGFDCIAFSSANGAEYFFEYLNEQNIDLRRLCGIRLAALGERARLSLQRRGLIPDILAKTHNAEGLAEAIAEDGKCKSVLIPCSSRGGRELSDRLKNIRAERLELFDTITDMSRAELFSLYEPTADCVVLTSGTCAGAYREILPHGGAASIAAIGASTKRRAGELGIRVAASAETPDVRAVADAIRRAVL